MKILELNGAVLKGKHNDVSSERKLKRRHKEGKTTCDCLKRKIKLFYFSYLKE